MRGSWIVVSVTLVGCAIPARDNPIDPSNRPPVPVARLRLADGTNPDAGHDGECLPAGSEASWPSATDVPRGRCVALDASTSERAAEAVFSFFRLDGSVEEDVVVGWLGSGASPVLVLTTAQKASIPLDEILRFRVDLDDGTARVSARVIARFTNDSPLITMSPPRSLPIGPYSWTAATTFPVTFTAQVNDPDRDRIAWCWTLPGVPPGDPANPASCDIAGEGPPADLPSLTIDVSILVPAELAVHLVVSDGTKRSLPATGIVDVRANPFWVVAYGGSAFAIDPHYSRATGFIQWVGPYGPDSVGLAMFEGGRLRLKLAPASNIAAVGPGGAILSGCQTFPSPQCFFPDDTYYGTNPYMSFAIDPAIGDPQAVWITHPGSDGRVRVAAAAPSNFSFFGTSITVTTAGDPSFAPIAVGDNVVWIATGDGVRAWDVTETFLPLGAVPPPAEGLHAHAIVARPFTNGFHEAFVLWSPSAGQYSEGTVLARYTIPDGGTMTVDEDPFPNAGSHLAFATADTFWAILPEELVLLDATTSPPTEILAVPSTNSRGIACNPVSSVCTATAANGSVVLELEQDGRSRIHGVPGQSAPRYRQYGGVVYSLDGGSAHVSTALAPTQSIITGSAFGRSGVATVWTVSANRLEEYSATGERLRLLQDIPAGNETLPLEEVAQIVVEPDDRTLWICAYDESSAAAVWRVDLEAVSATRVEDVTNCYKNTIHGAPQDAGLVWLSTEFGGLGTLDSSGTFTSVSNTWFPLASQAGSVDLCATRTLVVGTNGELAVEVARLAPNGLESGYARIAPVYGAPPGSILGIDIAASGNPSTCWVSIAQQDQFGANLTEVWSVDPAGTATLETTTDALAPSSSYYATLILATDPDHFWLIGDDPQTFEPRLRRFDRGLVGWSETPQSVESPYLFAKP